MIKENDESKITQVSRLGDGGNDSEKGESENGDDPSNFRLCSRAAGKMVGLEGVHAASREGESRPRGERLCSQAAGQPGGAHGTWDLLAKMLSPEPQKTPKTGP